MGRSSTPPQHIDMFLGWSIGGLSADQERMHVAGTVRSTGAENALHQLSKKGSNGALCRMPD
jgi:hypothetical protein